MGVRVLALAAVASLLFLLACSGECVAVGEDCSEEGCCTGATCISETTVDPADDSVMIVTRCARLCSEDGDCESDCCVDVAGTDDRICAELCP